MFTCTIPANGTLSNNGDGTFDYTPNTNFNGSETFIYEICDSGAPSLCATAAVIITVSNSNDAPVANEDSATTPEETLVTIDVAGNDTDVDGNLDPTSANTECAICSNPANGTLNNNGDGTFDYTPNTNFNGTDTFTYEICDSDTPSLCATAAVTITVSNSNDAPVANEDSATTPEETLVTIDVAGNDTDVDGNLDPASANTGCATCSNPANGILNNNGDGTFDYTPNTNFNGSDTFVYEICDSSAPSLCATAVVTITVSNINDAPVANAGADQTVTDSDGDGVETVTLDGSASTDSDGTVVSYQWSEGATTLGNGATVTLPFGIGSHTVTLTAADDAGASGSDTVIVTVNEAPPPQGVVAISGPTSISRGDNVSFTVILTNTGSATLSDMELSFSVSPNRRIKNLSPGSTVSVANVLPGESISQTWTGRGDKQGFATITVEAFSGGISIDTATQSLTVNK